MAEKVAELLVDYVGRNDGDAMNSLKRSLEILRCRAKDIEDEVEKEEMSCKKKRKTEVKNWLNVVNGLTPECDELEERVRSSRLPLIGDPVGKMQCRVDQLIEQRNDFKGLVLDDFDNNGEPCLPTKLFGKKIMGTLKEICPCLEDVNISSIGIYGMGGVGKTTLAKRIKFELEQSNYRVYWVTVPQEFSIRNLQDKIANVLGISLLDKDEEYVRANCRILLTDILFDSCYGILQNLSSVQLLQPSLQNPKCLEVSSCDELEEIVGNNDGEEAMEFQASSSGCMPSTAHFFLLPKETLKCMALLELCLPFLLPPNSKDRLAQSRCRPTITIGSDQPITFELFNCPKLKRLPSVSSAPKFKGPFGPIQMPSNHFFGEGEEIVGNNDEEEEATEFQASSSGCRPSTPQFFLLPKLKSLTLISLPKLKSVCSPTITIGGDQPTTFYLWNCAKLKRLPSFSSARITYDIS